MPFYAHNDIRSGQKVVAKYGDTVTKTEALKESWDAMVEAGVISEEKPGPQLTDQPTSEEEEA